MTPEQGKALMQRIESICKNAGVWCKITHDNQPNLKFIDIAIKIKVRGGKLSGGPR